MRFVESFIFDDETEYKRIIKEFYVEEDPQFKLGFWTPPFPNSREDSFAFGMVEVFSQSDIGECLIGEHGQVKAYWTSHA